jgi:uncharacterized membrane protein (UPF0136 family)
MPDERDASAYALAAILGLGVAAFDLFAVGGEVTPAATLALLVVAGGLFGLLRPHRPWRCALILGLALPAVHVAARALGFPDHVHPDTYAARLLMAPVAAAATLLGAYGGSVLREVFGS